MARARGWPRRFTNILVYHILVESSIYWWSEILAGFKARWQDILDVSAGLHSALHRKKRVLVEKG
jgi:hypothetical protein